MYKGTHPVEQAVEDVLRVAANDGSDDAKMWGHFYIGLYLEALGRAHEARPHLA